MRLRVRVLMYASAFVAINLYLSMYVCECAYLSACVTIKSYEYNLSCFGHGLETLAATVASKAS